MRKNEKAVLGSGGLVSILHGAATHRHRCASAISEEKVVLLRCIVAIGRPPTDAASVSCGVGWVLVCEGKSCQLKGSHVNFK